MKVLLLLLLVSSCGKGIPLLEAELELAKCINSVNDTITAHERAMTLDKGDELCYTFRSKGSMSHETVFCLREY